VAKRDPHEYMQPWVNLTYSAQLLLAKLNEALEEALGISIVEQEFLSQVGKAGGEIRMVDVAQNLSVSKAAVTKIVDRLEERDLVVRQPAEFDRRVINLVLTPEGKRILRGSWRLIEPWVKEHFADRLSRDEMVTLGEILQKLIESHGQWEAMAQRLRGPRSAKREP
jgi:DNA-binding MarR family transcriptional regulator